VHDSRSVLSLVLDCQPFERSRKRQAGVTSAGSLLHELTGAVKNNSSLPTASAL